MCLYQENLIISSNSFRPNTVPEPNQDNPGLQEYEKVSNAYNKIQMSLLEFCTNFYSHVPVSNSTENWLNLIELSQNWILINHLDSLMLE